MMKGFKRIISIVLIVVMIFSVNAVTGRCDNTVNAADTFAITSPANNSTIAAGYIDIKWNSASDNVKQYKLYIDGRLEAVTAKTSYEFYTTKVNYHTAWVEAELSNGTKSYTDTIKFGVSKKGICVDSGMARHIAPAELNISWYYNWGMSKFKSLTEDSKRGIEFAKEFGEIEFVPMVWSSNSYSDTNSKVNAAVSMGAKYILGYNEPDYKNQANMSVNQAVSYWQAFMNKNIRAGSPATAIWPTGSSDWFIPFMNQINATSNLDVDFITIHCYPNNFQGKEMAEWFLKNVVDECFNKYRKPIWITELSTAGTAITREGTAEFVKYVLPGLDKRAYVERYSLFSFDAINNHAGLWYHSTGALTNAGEIYRDNGNPVTTYSAGSLTNPKYSKDDTIKKVTRPKKVFLRYIKNLRGRKLKVSYKRAKGAKGYQIRIAGNKRFNGFWNKSTTKLTYTFKKLHKKTKYYVKVRAYTKKGRRKLYGPWSRVKKTIVRK